MLLRLDKIKAADSDGPMATEIGGSWWTGDARRDTESCLNWKVRNRKLLMKIRLSDGIDWGTLRLLMKEKQFYVLSQLTCGARREHSGPAVTWIFMVQ